MILGDIVFRFHFDRISGISECDVDWIMIG